MGSVPMAEVGGSSLLLMLAFRDVTDDDIASKFPFKFTRRSHILRRLGRPGDASKVVSFFTRFSSPLDRLHLHARSLTHSLAHAFIHSKIQIQIQIQRVAKTKQKNTRANDTKTRWRISRTRLIRSSPTPPPSCSNRGALVRRRRLPHHPIY